MTQEILNKRDCVEHTHILPSDHDLYRCDTSDFSFANSKLISFLISGALIKIGPTAEGPFVELPCPADKFIEVFGKPVGMTTVKPHL